MRGWREGLFYAHCKRKGGDIYYFSILKGCRNALYSEVKKKRIVHFLQKLQQELCDCLDQIGYSRDFMNENSQENL